MTSKTMTTQALRGELAEIELLLPPPGELPKPDLLARLQTYSLPCLYQIIVLAMIDGSYDLHRIVRTTSCGLRAEGQPLVQTSSIHACIREIDAEIRKAAGSVKGIRELSDVFYCGGEGPSEERGVARSIATKILSPMKDDVLFDLVQETAFYDSLYLDCDHWLCEGALALFFTKVGVSNHAKMSEVVRECRLMEVVAAAADGPKRRL